MSKNYSVIIASVAILILQLFICYHSFFFTAWDPELLINYAYDTVHSTANQWANNYFSRYPNNLFLEYIFIAIYRFADFIGLSSLINGTFLIIIIQSILNVLTGLLTYHTTLNLTKSYKVSWVAWVLYFVLIGSSAWFMIPYSDSIALIIPIFILWLFSTLNHTVYDYFKWFLILVVSFLGYKIKPQTIILLISIIAIQFITISFKKNLFIHLFKSFIPAFAVILMLNFGISKAINSLPFDINPNLSFGMSHFLMMGLNEETNGSFSGDDVIFSSSFKTKEDRQKANLKESFHRLKSFTPYTMGKHIMKKTLSNYGDGTFGWGQEAGQYFYKITFPDKQPGISSFIKNCVYNYGKYYQSFATLRQLTWFICLLLTMILLIFKGTSNNKNLLVIILSLIGLTLFETIFEARSRYFYIYVPFFIILASLGLQKLCSKNAKS